MAVTKKVREGENATKIEQGRSEDWSEGPQVDKQYPGCPEFA